MRKLSVRLLTRTGFVAATVGCWAATQAADVTAAEIVRFRHVKPATVHFLDPQTAQSYQERLRGVGCETKLSRHWGHTDLTYRCEEWREMQFERHEHTKEWMEFLGNLGFEAGHYH